MDKVFNNAKYIWKSNVQENDYARFRDEFPLAAKPRKAELYIACDTNYVVWINGKFVSTGQYLSCRGKLAYDVLDVSEFLNAGENVICTLVQYEGRSHFAYIKGVAGLIYRLEADGADVSVTSEETLTMQDNCYVEGILTRISNQLGFNFEMNNSFDDGWTSFDYKPGTEWENATVVTNQTAEIYPRPVEKCELKDRVDAQLITQGVFIRQPDSSKTVAQYMQSDFLSTRQQAEIFKPTGEVRDDGHPDAVPTDKTTLLPQKDCDGVYLVYDLGREECGFLELEVTAPAGTVFDIAYGQHLNDMRVRSAAAWYCNFANRYTSKDGHQTFTHYMLRHSGRYLQVHISNIKGEVKVHYAGFRPYEYPVTVHKLDTGDKLHDMIYDVSVRTLHLCMHDHYEDTPWREQGLYIMDARNQALCGYYCFDEYVFPLSNLRLIADSVRDDCFFEHTSPGEATLTIPTFSMIWVAFARDYVKYSGDVTVADEFLPLIDRMVTKYLSNAKDGLAMLPSYGPEYWNFYEWSEGLDGNLDTEVTDKTRVDAGYQLYLCLALKSAAEMCEMSGKDSSKYQKMFDSLSENFHKSFFNADKQAYCSFLSQGKQVPHFAELIQSLALFAGVVPKDLQSSLRELLASAGNGLNDVTLSHSIFKFEALMQEPAKYKDVILDQIARDWGHMLRCGATSFWELLEGAEPYGGASSLCHAWSAVPIYVYHKLKESGNL